MRKCKRILSILLVCILCFSSFQVNVSATETTDSDVQERLQLAQELGVEDWVDDEGYLIESFYEGKSDYELEQMGVSPLVRSLTDEELAENLSRLQSGISVRTVTAYQKVSDGVNTVGYFNVDNHLAFCIQHSVSTPGLNSPTSAPVESSNDNLRKVLYYGNGGPGDLGYNYIYTSLCASRANGYTSGCMGTTTTNIYNNIIAQASPPSGFHVYTVKTNGGSTQDLAYWIYTPTSNLTIEKRSTTDLSSGDGYKYVSGARFGLYAWNGSSYYGVLVATDNGNGTYTFKNVNRDWAVDGKFMVKEEIAPTGYSSNYFHFGHYWDEYDYNTYGGRLFQVDTNGNWRCASMETHEYPFWGFTFLDYPNETTLTITKVDSDTQQKLTGAEFELWAYTNASYPQYTRKVGDFTDNGDGTYSIKFAFDYATKNGNGYDYALRETKAPDGYELEPSEWGTEGKHIRYNANGTLSTAASELIIGNKATNGYLTLKKSSADTSITNDNSCYSLSGAVYGVYTDKECTKQTGTLTTTGDGSSNTLTLKAGTYYVKETTAPKGYALDTTVHTVTVTAGNTATLKVTDAPQSDPVKVLLGKIDKETNANKPQGSATLAGAEFTVKYYNVQMSSDPAKSGHTAVRSWVIRTDEDGYCRLSDTYKVSGDEFYMLDGETTLPLGTITIQETKAPEGYLINDEVFVRQITSDGTANKVETYNQPVIPETSLDLDIVKTEAGTTRAIPGVVFKHTLPDGTTEEVKTDSEGKAAFKGLTYGTHTVEEVSVPDGYTKNPGKVTFKVATDNTVTLTSNTSASATGSMTFSVQSDGCPLLKVEDVLAPYSLTVHKQNENGKVLEGAEFTLYSDVACKTMVGTATSDANGLLTFSDLTVGTEYYLKETKAPTGYRIPVNSDGSDIVYKINTASNPVKGTFEYYVNDEKHTDTTGDYAVTGTVAERVVNLKVINYTGIKMPETGTNTTILLFLLGTGFMLFAYAFMKEKKGRKIDYEKI